VWGFGRRSCRPSNTLVMVKSIRRTRAIPASANRARRGLHIRSKVQIQMGAFRGSHSRALGFRYASGSLNPTKDMLNGDDCNARAIIGNLSDWKVTPKEIPIDSCYSVAAAEHCTLQYSLTILIIIISCDSLKLLAMFLVLKMPGNPLTTLGDAIASFMENPDPTTAGRCLMNNADMQRKSRVFGLVAAQPFENQTLPKLGMTWSEVVAPRPVVWRSRNRRWYSVPSAKRWVALYSM